jgi:hypothetical protein
MSDLLPAPCAKQINAQTARILKGTCYDQTWRLLLDGLAMCAITAGRYGRTRSRYGMSLGDLQDILLLSSSGAQDFTDYIETGHYRRSPQYRWMVENEGAKSLGLGRGEGAHRPPVARQAGVFGADGERGPACGLFA